MKVIQMEKKIPLFYLQNMVLIKNVGSTRNKNSCVYFNKPEFK